MFVKDKNTNVSFLIDTGSDVSILPAPVAQKRQNAIQKLSAANSSPINVFGTKLLTLDFNLRRKFQWSFLIATVSVPIIGADFLYYFNLSPDLRNKKLVDLKTNLSSKAKLASTEIHSIKLVSGDTVFHDLLRTFPEITRPPIFSQEVKHNVMHHIETFGPPVFSKPRRLAPDRLKIAKAEFEHMLELGHIRPSSSSYASPLHMVPKKRQFGLETSWRFPLFKCSN